MNLIGWILLLYLIRLYYKRKWRGKHPGDPLDIAWIKKRIDCSDIEKNGTVIRCHFENGRHYFLVQGSDALEWHTYAFDKRTGWHLTA